MTTKQLIIFFNFSFLLCTNMTFAQTEKTYYENGAIEAEMKFNKKGELNGKYKEFYENGKLKLKGKYKKDLKRGTWEEYDNAGSLIKEYNYNKRGNLTGSSSFTYNSKGKLDTSKKYDSEGNYMGYLKYTYLPPGKTKRIMGYSKEGKLIYEKVISYYYTNNIPTKIETDCDYLYANGNQKRSVTCKEYNTKGQLEIIRENGKVTYQKKK